MNAREAAEAARGSGPRLNLLRRGKIFDSRPRLARCNSVKTGVGVLHKRSILSPVGRLASMPGGPDSACAHRPKKSRMGEA
jgi:hypothetical protein